MTLTIVALDHLTMRWEEQIDPKIALALGVVMNEHAEQSQAELAKAQADFIIHGSCVVKHEFDGDRLVTKHVPFGEQWDSSTPS